ncbi:MAG: hypothetical protein WAT71_01345 [Ignavibacteria bacterium]
MSKKYLIPLLLILPVLLFISAGLLKYAQGPYYLNFYDPSYVYLINGLNLAQLNGYGVGHFDHPGTTVQVISAVVIKFYYAVSSVNIDVVKDVFSRPEEYLIKINVFLNFINCLVLFLFGYFLYARSKNIYLTLLIMLSPFVSTELFYGMIIVTPDNLLITASLFVIGIIFYCLYKEDQNYNIKEIIIFAAIIAFGLATKLNFIPMILIPMIMLSGIKNKIIFLTFCLIFFVIFILPGISNIEYFLKWIEGLILREGKHGKGAANVINTASFSKNLFTIFKTDILFTISYFTLLITYSIVLYKKHIKKSAESIFKTPVLYRLLAGILTAMTLQLIIVSKHYAQYYMIPSFMLTVSGFYISYLVIFEIAGERFRTVKTKVIYIFSSSVLVMIISYQIISSYYEGTEQKNDAYSIVNFIEEKYPTSLIIPSFGSANKEAPLAFASMYAGSMKATYKNLLGEQLNSDLFFNQWINEFYILSEEKNPLNNLTGNKKIYLQLNKYGSIEEFANKLSELTGKKNISYNVIFTNAKMESVYEIFLR